MISAHSLKPCPCGDTHYAAAARDAINAGRAPRAGAARPCLRNRFDRTTRTRCDFLRREGAAQCDGCPGAHNFHPGGDASG